MVAVRVNAIAKNKACTHIADPAKIADLIVFRALNFRPFLKVQ